MDDNLIRVGVPSGMRLDGRRVAMVARLAHRAGIPVVASCTSAVFAMQVLTVPRIALVNPAELNLLVARRESTRIR